MKKQTVGKKPKVRFKIIHIKEAVNPRAANIALTNGGDHLGGLSHLDKMKVLYCKLMSNPP